MLVTLVCSNCNAVRDVRAGRNKSGLCHDCYQTRRTVNRLADEETKERARIRAREAYAANPEKFRAKARVWHRTNNEMSRANAKAWKEANPARKQQHTRKFNLSKYGVTPERYAEMFTLQDGVCAICGEPPPEGQNLHVDHCHASNQVRKLLCAGCNNGLGRFRDSPGLLRAAAIYLEEHSEHTVRAAPDHRTLHAGRLAGPLPPGPDRVGQVNGVHFRDLAESASAGS